MPPNDDDDDENSARKRVPRSGLFYERAVGVSVHKPVALTLTTGGGLSNGWWCAGCLELQFARAFGTGKVASHAPGAPVGFGGRRRAGSPDAAG